MRLSVEQLLMMRRSLALTVTVGLAIAPVSLAHATSGATFTKKADGTCAAAGAKIEALPKITKSNFTVVFAKELTVLSSLLNRLDAIKPPASKATRYRAFLSATRQQIPLGRKTIAAIKARQASRAETLAKKLDAAGRRSDKLAAALNLKDCAKQYDAGGPGATSA